MVGLAAGVDDIELLLDAAETGVSAMRCGDGVRERSKVGSAGPCEIGERCDSVGIVEGGNSSSSAASEWDALFGGVATVGEDSGCSVAGCEACLCFWIWSQVRTGFDERRARVRSFRSVHL